MKCVKKSDKVMRVPEQRAKELISQGWSYCPKSEYKGSSNKELVEKAAPIKREGPKVKRKRPNKETSDGRPTVA